MIKMRQQFAETIATVIKSDERLAVLLGDIGVFAFRNIFAEFPTRVYNIGILEQSTVSVASGLSMTGFIPVIHTITPFLVERAFEQIKVDFGYQSLAGNFVSIGASYDYAGLGCSHHCPGDVRILKNIPNMSLIVPGTAIEFDRLFKQAYALPTPNYYRLSEESNQVDHEVNYGKAVIVKKATVATAPVVLAVGPMLQYVMDATKEIDATILYYTTVRPFDADTLRSVVNPQQQIILCEPYYAGGITEDITEALQGMPISIFQIGVPHHFLTHYGTMADHTKDLGLDADGIKAKILGFIKK